LSMYPHEHLLPLVHAAGITHHFTRIDGSSGTDLTHKAPHLERHLAAQGIPASRAVIVGDSLDDARAARACGVRCVLYHPGEDALHSRDHFADAGVPVVATLTAAVELLLAAGVTSRGPSSPGPGLPAE
jgi:phosphoglycolate phosphatase-like HAD superfamily hydrolase